MFTALPALAVLAGLGALLAWQHRSSSVDDRRTESRELANAAATNARRFIDDQFAILSAVSAASSVRGREFERMQPFFVEVARTGRFSSGVAWADTKGLSRVSSNRPLGSAPVDLSDRDYVQGALSGRPTVSPVLLGRLRNRPIVAFGYPTKDLEGRRSGAITASVALDQFDEGLRRLLYAPGSGETILDGVDHVIVGDEPVQGIVKADAALPIERMRREGAGTIDKLRLQGGDRLVGFASVQGTDWLVVVDRPFGETIGALDTAFWAEIAALVLLAVVGVIVTFSTGRRLDRLDREREGALEEQRTIAVQLQRSLLPDLPNPAGLGVTAVYGPAQGGMSVGGDWYDVVETGDGQVALSVGDVAGHGLNAAAVMGQMRSAVRALALGNATPTEALGRLDQFVATIAGRPLATVLYGVLDTGSGRLLYAAAGHPPPLVVRADGSAEFLEGGRSPLLGVEPGVPREEGEAELEPGDTLIVYTDGLIERPDASIDAGMANLADLARGAAARPDTLAEVLLASVAEPRRDDAAVLCVRVEGAVAPAQPSSVPS